jgi:predicted MFS family arabinose efflux permease
MRTGSWGSIGLIYLIPTIAGGAIGKLIPLVPDIARSLDSSPQAVAWLISAISAVSVVLAPVGGLVADRLGDRPLIAIGLVVATIGNVTDVFALSFNALLGARLIEGAGFLCMTLGSTAMMVRTIPTERQPAAMSLLATAMPVGVGFSVALAGLAAGDHWRNAFWVHGGLTASALLIVRFLPVWTPAQAGSRTGSVSWWTVLTASGPLSLSLGTGISTIVLFGLGALFPTFLMETHHLSAAQAGAFGVISYPASILGSLMFGGIISRYKNVRMMILFSLIAVAVSGAVAFVPTLGVSASAAVLCLFYLIGGVVGAIAMSRLPTVVPNPNAMGTTSSLYMLLVNVGILVGAPLTFGAYGAGGASGVAILAIACPVATLLLWYFNPRVSAAQG